MIEDTPLAFNGRTGWTARVTASAQADTGLAQEGDDRAVYSPTLAGRFIYLWGNQGTCILIESGKTFKQVVRNHLESLARGWPPHQEATTTEQVLKGQPMYYRAEHTLYGIGPR